MSNMRSFMDYCDSMMIATEGKFKTVGGNIKKYIIMKKEAKLMRKEIKEKLIQKGFPVKSVSSLISGKAARKVMIDTFHNAFDNDYYFILILVEFTDPLLKIREREFLDIVFGEIKFKLPWSDRGVMNTKDKTTYAAFLSFKYQDTNSTVTANDVDEYWK